MPLFIIKDDITKLSVDAIVNAANNTLLGGGGVDGAIHRAAGKKLLEKCKTLGGCKTGEAKITKGYDLPAKYVIHTVGPIWRGGGFNERESLVSCYRNSLLLAKENKCKTVAFPVISSGAYGYPKGDAFRVATDTVLEFLSENDMTVYIVIYDKAVYEPDRRIMSELSYFIDRNYENKQALNEHVRASAVLFKSCACEDSVSLDDALRDIDESFSEMLLRKIDEKGMTDAECYKKANIDRKLFSKIRKDAHYKPSKTTAIAFAIALELSLDETEDMLKKAGFALSHSNKFDIIIEYFIRNENYNIFEINEALFAFDQSLLGA